MRKWSLVSLALSLGLGCALGTSRPEFGPVPEAHAGDLELEPSEATERLARALVEAGIPVNRVSPADGYLESPWFDTTTGRATSARPLGQRIVRVRGWVTPSAHGASELRVETVYRPVADPSRSPRELERSVAFSHPVRERVREAFRRVGARITLGEPDALTLSERRAARRRAAELAPAADSAARADSLAVDSLAPDSLAREPLAQKLAAAGDSARAARPDTAPARVTPMPRDTTTPAAPAVRAPAAAPRPRPAAPQPTPVAPAPAGGGYSVQVAATSDSAAAAFTARRLGAMGIEPNVVREAGLFKVRSGVYPSQSAVQTVLGRVRRSFPDAFVVRQ
ncbi:MAG TPA: SPOR domain-containing protein [Gemmatimonadales bacterium]|nr:SPOR domain-containing protein [Gemmatimonadales bacterium]